MSRPLACARLLLFRLPWPAFVCDRLSPAKWQAIASDASKKRRMKKQRKKPSQGKFHLASFNFRLAIASELLRLERPLVAIASSASSLLLVVTGDGRINAVAS